MAFFHFWKEAMPLFKPFGTEIFQKLAFKNNKKRNFKILYLKCQGEFRG